MDGCAHSTTKVYRTAVAELLAEAERLLRATEPGPAAEFSSRALAIDPSSPRAHWLAGCALAMQNQLEPAIAAFTQATVLDPTFAAAQFDLALALSSLGRPQEALAPIRSVIAAVTPCPAPVHRLHLRLLFELRLWDDALRAADGGLAEIVDDAELTALRGAVLRTLGRPDEALAAQEALLAKSPGNVPALCEKGWALLALKRPAAAVDAFDQALDGDEQPLSALAGMGVAEMQLGMHAAALAALDQTLAMDPNSFEGHFFRALTLQEMGRFHEAKLGYDEVLRRWPQCADAYANLGSIQRDSGDLEAAVESQRQALAMKPDRPATHSNLLLTMLYQPGQTPLSLAREHAAWGARFGTPDGRYTTWPNARALERPLHIGFVSAEFCSHPVSAWLIPALEALDRQRFIPICYSTRLRRDAVTDRIESMAAEWRTVVDMTDHAMAEQIRADAIDILIDLSGHTGHNRLPVFALKPAPVQASWLGYPFTTGLAAIDYAIMDPIAVRPGEESAFVEQVVRLPGGRFCYEPPAAAPAVVQPPAITNGWVTFGSFNNITKLTPEVLQTWLGIMQRLPMTRLILKSPALAAPAVADRIRAAFCNQGITSGRIELRAGSRQADLLAQYGDIDIALDPFPFGGGATSCEALWMGVPVVTVTGWQPVSRQTETCLRAIGREEWVARDLDAYERIATDLARDPLRLGDLRCSQRETMRTSPLCNKARMGRELGEAFHSMWRTFVERSSAA